MKNEVDVLGSPVPNTNCPHGLCGRKATLKKMGVKHKLSVYSATPFFNFILSLFGCDGTPS